MLSLEQTKIILKNPALSDEEALAIRDQFRMLAEIIFEQWQKDRAAKKLKAAKRENEAEKASRDMSRISRNEPYSQSVRPFTNQPILPR